MTSDSNQTKPKTTTETTKNCATHAPLRTPTPWSSFSLLCSLEDDRIHIMEHSLEILLVHRVSKYLMGFLVGLAELLLCRDGLAMYQAVDQEGPGLITMISEQLARQDVCSLRARAWWRHDSYTPICYTLNIIFRIGLGRTTFRTRIHQSHAGVWNTCRQDARKVYYRGHT